MYCTFRWAASWMAPLWWSLLLGEVVASAAALEVTSQITLQEGKLSVYTAGMPLQQVLEEVSQLSHTQLVWLTTEGREELISAEFADLPVAEGIERLLRQKNFVLFYAQTSSGSQLTQIWIGSGQKRTQPPAPQDAAAKPPRSFTGKKLSGEQADSPPPLGRTALQKMMQIAMADPDPSARVNAVVYVGAHAQDDDPRVKRTLERIALDDANSGVRKVAAETLQAIRK
jgi:hypothetical protein